jgi:hypothetical protein
MVQGAVLPIAVEVNGQEAKRGDCAEECKGTEDVVISSFHVFLPTPRNLFHECIHHVFAMTEKKGVDAGKRHKTIRSSVSKNRKGSARGIFHDRCVRGVLHLTGASDTAFRILGVMQSKVGVRSGIRIYQSLYQFLKVSLKINQGTEPLTFQLRRKDRLAGYLP